MITVTNIQNVEVGDYPYQISFNLIWIGMDVQVLVGGGTHPHIGAVAAAFWDNSSAQVWHKQFPHHKEGELAVLIAESLCNRLKTNVSVSVGIHVDHATKDEILLLVKNAKMGLEKVLQSI